MSINLEIERKFLVNFPTSWSELAEMFDDLIDVKRITQSIMNEEIIKFWKQQNKEIHQTRIYITTGSAIIHYYGDIDDIPVLRNIVAFEYTDGHVRYLFNEIGYDEDVMLKIINLSAFI